MRLGGQKKAERSEGVTGEIPWLPGDISATIRASTKKQRQSTKKGRLRGKKQKANKKEKKKRIAPTSKTSNSPSKRKSQR